MMRNFIILISFCLLFLVGVKATAVTLQPQGEQDMEYILSEEYTSDGLLLSSMDFQHTEKIFDEAESFARQLRSCNRNQRNVSLRTVLLSKSFAFRNSLSRQQALFKSKHHVYSSLPLLNWQVSSEHYIFGMRRILI